MGRGDAGAEQRRRDRRRCYSNGHPDLEVRTASEEAEIEVDKLRHRAAPGPRALRRVRRARPGRARPDRRPGCWRRRSRSSGARASTRTTRPARGWPRSASGSPRSTRSSAATSATTSAPCRRRPSSSPACRRTGWTRTRPTTTGWSSVTTDYPDAVPARMFVRDRRRSGARSPSPSSSAAGPHNEPLLKELFDLRHEYANLVGYSDWASYDAAVKMIEKGPAIPEFIDRIAQVAQGPMERDLAVVMERFRQDVPDADAIDVGRLRLLRGAGAQGAARRRLAAGAHLLRVRQGAAGAARRDRPAVRPALRAGRRTRWCGTRTSRRTTSSRRGTETDGESLGRIYLDLHPREGKYKHAAQFTITNGVAGRQLPEGALVCNFNKGLMEHDHVVTLFHEFGHLVHHVLGGHVGWTRFAGVATEWDFVEAPSQMLEEWAWDADVLQTFATNAAGEPIPADLVDRMRAADDFGKGLQARQQMFYAAVSYWFHTERPADLTAQAGRAPGALLAVPLHRRHPLLRQLRPPRRLLVGLLHLHVVAGDREGPVLRLRPRRHVRRRRSPAATATGSSPRAAPRTPPTWSPTSSAGPTPSTRTPPGWRGRRADGIPGYRGSLTSGPKLRPTSASPAYR